MTKSFSFTRFLLLLCIALEFAAVASGMAMILGSVLHSIELIYRAQNELMLLVMCLLLANICLGMKRRNRRRALWAIARTFIYLFVSMPFYVMV